MRVLHKVAGLLVPHGFDGGYLFARADWRILAEDMPEQQDTDRETIEAWRRAQGIDWATEVEKARGKLLARLEAHSKN